ncbi:MAG TPA: DUF2752 domain-containing protein [Thermoanaerobaculia bacterium]|nr:DUF2752 domain-containing protein [Thermoanaerobaculia bacterium]HQR68362.1 DUF2752 domain-containing protein [Thermoanaerobaculia bacterium]
MAVARERQLGLFWGAAALGLLVLSPAARLVAPGLPPCFFHSVTGLPCPTCGGTRAALALLEGDVALALHLNPLVTAALALLVGGGLLAGLVALAGRGVKEPARLPGWTRAAVVLLLAANWLWLIVDGR